ncbi:MAG: PIN domain-containing protein [Egibacteraceae bacterium]
MIRLYVETNFVLELTFDQEQSAACEQLRDFAEEGRVELVVPAYCLAEPHETFVRRRKKRQISQNEIEAELKQLRRSTSYKVAAEQIELVAALFAASAQEDLARLEDAVTRLAEAATLLPLTPRVVRRAYHLQKYMDIGPQDSFVLASVLDDLDDRPSSKAWFANRNTKDFEDPDVEALLADRNCQLLTSFGAAVGLIRH